jgi:rod shape-determining protein MreD
VALVTFLCGGLGLLLDGPQARHLFTGYAPDMAALAVVWLALRSEAWAAVAAAFVLGFMRDGISAGPSGGWALVLILEALALKGLASAAELDRAWGAALALFLSVSVAGLVLYPILMYIYFGVSPVRMFYLHFSIYCIQGLTTALAGIPAFRILDRVAAGRRG